MEPLEAGSIQLELKYCERCGALWLRPQGSDLVFCGFFFARSAQWPPMRRRITELVARNAVSMVQQAIDAVKEEGQYQAIKHLFEMIGLYPAAADDESEAQSSLTQTLLDHLGLSEVTDQKTTAKKVTGRDPLKLK